jgi:hypothetical protein
MHLKCHTPITSFDLPVPIDYITHVKGRPGEEQFTLKLPIRISQSFGEQGRTHRCCPWSLGADLNPRRPALIR